MTKKREPTYREIVDRHINFFCEKTHALPPVKLDEYEAFAKRMRAVGWFSREQYQEFLERKDELFE